MKSLLKNKKAQLGGLGNAPVVVMIVGLVFLTMATVALIGEKYGDALDTDNTAATAVNESVTSSKTAGLSATLAANNLENGACGTITAVYNGTGAGGVAIAVGNFTQTGCSVVNSSSMLTYSTALLFNYPYTYSAQTVASNTTTDLTTEISNNTSIAGIILTISLIGIVLGILIGVFFGITRRSSRV